MKSINGGGILSSFGKFVGKVLGNMMEAYGDAYNRHIEYGGSHGSMRG
ncbi:hypothetical protein [Roseivirga seohaensis]|nr:hypothetical protein [Roseivirga seohaensis]